MALIRESKGRKKHETASGYERVVGHPELGNLLSKIQATTIRQGNELENVLASKITNPKGISIAKLNKEGRIFKGIKNGKNIAVDAIVHKDGEYELIEIKDGDTFDTKKVAGEVASLNLVKTFLIKKGVPENKIKLRFCSFNARDHDQINRGAKNLLSEEMAMTGRELCSLLNLDFDKIVEERKQHQKENLRYVKEELKKIKELS